MGADGWPNDFSLSGGDAVLNCTLVYSTKTNAAIPGD
jgi:hypothetical protein